MVFAVVALGSLASPRPLMFRLARAYGSGRDPAAEAKWDARWEFPQFRSALRRLTVIWGVVLLAEAALRFWVIVALPSAHAAVWSYAVDLIALGGLIAYTIVRSRIGERRLAQAGR